MLLLTIRQLIGFVIVLGLIWGLSSKLRSLSERVTGIESVLFDRKDLNRRKF